jgi:hypothetical protein
MYLHHTDLVRKCARIRHGGSGGELVVEWTEFRPTPKLGRAVPVAVQQVVGQSQPRAYPNRSVRIALLHPNVTGQLAQLMVHATQRLHCVRSVTYGRVQHETGLAASSAQEDTPSLHTNDSRAVRSVD